MGPAGPARLRPAHRARPDARGSSPASWGPAAADAARAHEAALDLLVGIASRELHLGRVAEEIRATSRRIHALEDVVAPRLAAEAARISLALEERAREESVRLKRFRSARLARASRAVQAPRGRGPE